MGTPNIAPIMRVMVPSDGAIFLVAPQTSLVKAGKDRLYTLWGKQKKSLDKMKLVSKGVRSDYAFLPAWLPDTFGSAERVIAITIGV